MTDPLNGTIVDQLRFDYALTLVLGDAEIHIAAPFTIVANGDQQSPPILATPGQAGPWVGVIVPLLHARVDRVTVHDSDTLQVDVENLSLIVQPSGLYESWDLQGPAGRRLVGLPSGGVADLTPGVMTSAPIPSPLLRDRNAGLPCSPAGGPDDWWSTRAAAPDHAHAGAFRSSGPPAFREGEVTIWGELVVSAERGLVVAAHPKVSGQWMVSIVDMVNTVVDHFRITDGGRLEIEASGILLVVDADPHGAAWTVAGPRDRFVEVPDAGSRTTRGRTVNRCAAPCGSRDGGAAVP